MAKSREFDIIVFGASGYTGRLVAEHLATRYPTGNGLKWAMAGRSLEKLAAIRTEMGITDAVPLIAADSSDRSSLDALCLRTNVVLTTVGPYQIYGAELVAACANTGTDYVDLCGEPTWMRVMIDANAAAAKASGARIVFSCGFDSIPSDLGVLFLQNAAKAKFGRPAQRIKGRVRKMKGTFSGGTAASLQATMVAAFKDPAVLALLKNPFALTPGFTGPAQPPGMKPEYDEKLGSWCAPFIMAGINTRIVHRSNFLLNHPYGADFVYDEMMLTGPGERGETTAKAIAADKSMAGKDAPKPGEGPSKAEREAGSFDLLFIAEMADGQVLKAAVTGDKDPGYGSTSKMISETAIALVRDVPDGPGSIGTPASILGEPLIGRLVANAGLTFKLEA